MLQAEQRRRAPLAQRWDGLGPARWGLEVNERGRIAARGHDYVEIAARFGTPLHIVDHARLVQNYREFVGAFRKRLPNVQLATSYKTNPLPGVLKALHEAGTWAEVISHFELWLALGTGIDAERIVLNGPGKGPESVALAVERGIGLINLDGPDEVPWVVENCRRLGTQQRVGLRVVTSVGWSSQFGTRIAAGESFDTFTRIAKHPELLPCALHMHLGTGLKDVKTYLRAIREVLEFARELRERLGIVIDCYDFGGGFGVPTVRSIDEWDGRMIALGMPPRMPLPDDTPSISDYAEPIADLIEEFHPGPAERGPRILFEPGRAITSSAQSLMLRVLTVKQSRDGRPKLILDGGKNLTIPLGYETHQVFAANRMDAPENTTYDVYGPLCHPGDVIAHCKQMPEMSAGDYMLVMDAGAYFIPNQMNFSFPRPPAVMIRDGKVTMIRERESFDDIVRLDVPTQIDAQA